MSKTSTIAPLRLGALYEVSRKINSQLDPDRLLDEIMDHAIELLNAEKGVILLKDPQNSGTFDVRVARNMEKQNLRDAVSMSRTVIDKVEKEGEPVLLQKVPEVGDAATSKSMVMYKLKSIICVPLRTNELMIGSIYLDTTDPHQFFQERDVDFLEAFANMAAISIEKAQSYRKIADLNASLERKVARRTEELRQKNEELTRAYRDLQDTQIQLIRSEKLASLGRLVAGIAHEVNTPLGALTANMDLFMRSFAKVRDLLAAESPDGCGAEGSKAQRTIATLEGVSETSLEACTRISDIVKALRNFARLDEEEHKKVDIHEGLNSLLVLTEPEFRERITVIRDFGTLPQLHCKPAQLNQAFFHIFSNALDAIEGKGEVHITTREAQSRLVIEFRDSGVGIPHDNLHKIFDPGFTTKGVGVGIGLSLSLCYKIIQDHHGSIEVASETGKGTTVTIKLPVNFPSPAGRSPQSR